MSIEEVTGIAGNNDHPVTKGDRDNTAEDSEKKLNGQRGDRTQDLRVISTATELVGLAKSISSLPLTSDWCRAFQLQHPP